MARRGPGVGGSAAGRRPGAAEGWPRLSHRVASSSARSGSHHAFAANSEIAQRKKKRQGKKINFLYHM